MAVDSHGALQTLSFVFFLGAVNWIVTLMLVSALIFEDLRELFDKLGKRVEKRHPRVGRKISDFFKCALCVGVWIGFIQAGLFGGPLRLEGGWAWATFIANGLLYKAVGHLLLQVNAWFHGRVELLKWLARCAEHEAKEYRDRRDLEAGLGDEVPVPGDRQKVNA